MAWVLGGIAVLFALMVLVNQLVKASAAQLARILRWIAIAVVGVVGIALLFRQSISPGMMTLLITGLLVWLQARAQGRGWGASQPTPSGQTTDVETAWVRMTLDHDSGETDGLVLKGRHAGLRLSELSAGQVMAVLAEARIEDPEAALLIEAYLVRVHPDAAPDPEEQTAGGSSRAGMTREEALEILGLSEGAEAADIRAAHRRLMQAMHPDMGGSDYLAAKINEARDVLTGSR